MKEKDYTCNCPGYAYEKCAPGARGGSYQACVNCGKAVRPRNDDSYRYFYAETENWCSCANPSPSPKKEYHQVWCNSRRDEFPELHK